MYGIFDVSVIFDPPVKISVFLTTNNRFTLFLRVNWLSVNVMNISDSRQRLIDKRERASSFVAVCSVTELSVTVLSGGGEPRIFVQLKQLLSPAT